MIIYYRLTHTMSDGCRPFSSSCYSGNGEGLNNPKMESVHNVGPLPAGIYDMTEIVDSPHTGKSTIILKPKPENEMFGRSEFRIHGDNAEMNHTASDGCIVLPGAQNRIALFRECLDKTLKVI